MQQRLLDIFCLTEHQHSWKCCKDKSCANKLESMAKMILLGMICMRAMLLSVHMYHFSIFT